jgi:ATP-dependent Clp endopeptidase proteolytic subunit ClpP
MRWYEIKAKSDVSEIWLYDEIGKDWLGEGISAKEFLVELNAIKSPKIDLRINSIGGAVFDGAAIYNAIRRHSANVTTYIDGIAASIASVIALAGDKVIMAKNALYMMHNPSGFAYGNSEDMRKVAGILDKVRDTMLSAYREKTGKSDEEITALLDGETWLEADQALEAGFVDEIGDKMMDLAACAQFIPTMSKMGFKNIPQVLQAKKEVPSQKELERFLRDAGCSRKVAKSILAKGYSEDLCDAGADEDLTPVAAPPRDVEEPKPPTRKDTAAELRIRAARLLGTTI